MHNPSYKMTKYCFLLCLLTLGKDMRAQPESNPGMAELSEKVIPWEKALPPYGNGTPTYKQGLNHNFSAYHRGLIDIFADWIKKSFIPIGGLPQQVKQLTPDGTESIPFVPNGSGVTWNLWVPCYAPDHKRIIQAQPASSTEVSIYSNVLPGRSAATWLNTDKEYYFTMMYDKYGKMFTDEDRRKEEPRVNDMISKVGNYMVYFTGERVNVLLMPIKELPIIQLTKAEVLQKGEECINRAFKNGKLMPFQKDESLETIRQLREKYKNSLNDPAFINNSQLGIYSFSKTNDLFKKEVSVPFMYPVYRFKPEVYEQSKKDKTLWVTVSFPTATERSTTLDWGLYKAMTKNFNYAYVYDYFFNPEKVKGKPYQPLNPISAAATAAENDKKNVQTTQTKTLPEGTLLMEDFSTSTSGKMPAGWTSKENNRGFIIETPAGEKGKWLLFDNSSTLIPSAFKFPTPDNFTLEYDLCSTDFTGRSGRSIELYLVGAPGGGKPQASGEYTSANITITPGNADNLAIYPAEAYIRLQLPTKIKYDPISYTMNPGDYSNKKHVAHVVIKKAGRSLTVSVNGNPLLYQDYYKVDKSQDMLLPENIRFTSMTWSCDNKDETRGKVYITNIKLTKQ